MKRAHDTDHAPPPKTLEELRSVFNFTASDAVSLVAKHRKRDEDRTKEVRALNIESWLLIVREKLVAHTEKIWELGMPPSNDLGYSSGTWYSIFIGTDDLPGTNDKHQFPDSHLEYLAGVITDMKCGFNCDYGLASDDGREGIWITWQSPDPFDIVDDEES